MKYPDRSIVYSRLYHIYQSIKQRCYYPKAISYKLYGAKGIVMCDGWKNDFMGNPIDGKWSHPKYGNPNSKYAYYVVQNFSNYEIIPCWSLTALLSIIPSVIIRKGKRMFLTLEKACAYNLYYKSPDRIDELWETKEDVIDACVTMIENLHELKML